MNSEEWHQRLLWLVIGAIIMVIATVYLQPFMSSIRDGSFIWPDLPRPSNSTATPIAKPTTTTTIPRLKPTYSGTYVGISDDVKGNHGDVVFTVQSQDSKGNVAGTLRYNDSSAIDPCTGNITVDRHITFTCHDGNRLIDFRGLIYSDGHIEATETYTEAGTAYKNILA